MYTGDVAKESEEMRFTTEQAEAIRDALEMAGEWLQKNTIASNRPAKLDKAIMDAITITDLALTLRSCKHWKICGSSRDCNKACYNSPYLQSKRRVKK